METKYEVVRDLQGACFGTDRQYTIEEWRQQAIDWLKQDEASEETIAYFMNLPKDMVLDKVMEWWDLEIEHVKILQNQ